MRAAFFGSIVRGGLADESDVVVLVEFAGRKRLMDLSGPKIAALGGDRPEVDILTRASLHPLLKERILAVQVPIL